MNVPQGMATHVAQITGAAGAAATITLPAVAGNRHCITSIHIYLAADGAEAAGVVTAITSTNLHGIAWTVGSLIADGVTINLVNEQYPGGLLAAAAGTATTIVVADPGTTPVISGHATYFLVPEL